MVSCVQLHEFDEVRFDIRAHDCTYFFRAASPDEKNSWIEVIEANKVSDKSVTHYYFLVRLPVILSLTTTHQIYNASYI